ncbi:MAG: hypothetical protein ABID09_02945, partial [Candidatus Omnitrophota bacterium]
ARIMAGVDTEKLSKTEETGTRMAKIAAALPQETLASIHTSILYNAAFSQPDVALAVIALKDKAAAPTKPEAPEDMKLEARPEMDIRDLSQEIVKLAIMMPQERSFRLEAAKAESRVVNDKLLNDQLADKISAGIREGIVTLVMVDDIYKLAEGDILVNEKDKKVIVVRENNKDYFTFALAHRENSFAALARATDVEQQILSGYYKKVLFEPVGAKEPEAPKAEGGEIAKGWLKDRIEKAQLIQDVFDMVDKNNRALISKIEPSKEAAEAVKEAVDSLLENISRFETSPPAGIREEYYIKAKEMLKGLAAKPESIAYFTARVEPGTGHLLGFGKADGIAIAPDVVTYLMIRTDLTRNVSLLVQEYILHEVLEAVTPAETHNKLYQVTQNDFFKGISGYGVDKNSLGVALGGFNDEKRLAANLQGKDIDAAAISEMASIYRMANNGIAFEENMPFAIEVNGVTYNLPLAEGADVKKALIEFVNDENLMAGGTPEVREEILETIAGYEGALRYEVAFAIGREGKIQYYTDRSIMAFKADGKSYDFKSTNRFDANNTRWLIHSHPVMPAGEEEFARDIDNLPMLGNAGSIVLLPGGSIRILKMPVAPLAMLKKPGLSAVTYTFAYADRAYSEERLGVASAYKLIEGILTQDITSVSIAELFTAVRKLHEAGISPDTVILAFDGKSVINMETGKTRNAEFAVAFDEAKKNEGSVRMALIARTPAEEAFLEKNVPGVAVVLVNDGDKPSEKIADAMRADGVIVGNIAVLLEGTDTSKEIRMIGADAESARKAGREGTLAYALIKSADIKAVDVPVSKINLANLLASIAMRGAFVAIGYNEGDKSIQSLSGYFGFFKIFMTVSEALGKMLKAMNAVARSV